MFVYYVYDLRTLLTPFFKEVLVIMKYYILCEFLVYHYYVIHELRLYIMYICLDVCILL